MWGERGLNLIKEYERSQETMPAYEDDCIRLVLEEMRALTHFIEEAMSTTFDPETNNFMAGVKVRQAALERNKRCLLAYQYNRLQRLRQMRWEFGTILPPEIKSNLSESEVTWLNKYNQCLAKYMRTVGGKFGLDLTQDITPPKDLFIEVRCLEDYGKIELDNGDVLMLNKNSQHLIPRAQCELLIRQGVLEQIHS